MFQFLQDLKERRQGNKAYQEILNGIVSTGALSHESKAKLEDTKKRFGLRKKDVVPLENNAVAEYFRKLCEKHRITEAEITTVNMLASYFDLQPKDFGFDQNKLNTYANLAKIDRGVLPEIRQDVAIPFPLEKGEVLHNLEAAILRKHKKITRRINYGGFTSSIRIVKGLRYRAGSLNVGRVTQDILAPEDNGIFYITNKRVGFHGQEHRFSVPFGKINSFELNPEGMYLFKNGKEAPYIFTMVDYELPATIVSFIINSTD